MAMSIGIDWNATREGFGGRWWVLLMDVVDTDVLEIEDAPERIAKKAA
jgi:hypothetical protein